MFKTFSDAQGVNWSCNESGCANVVMAYAYVKALMECSRMGTESVGMGFTAAKVDFDPREVKAKKNELYGRCYVEFLQRRQKDGGDGFDYLVALRKETTRFRSHRSNMFRSVESDNQTTIDLAESSLAITRTYRDLGFTTLGILAAVGTGGWFYAAGAAAAVGGGVGKYQDTGKADQAIIAGVGGLVMLGWGAVGKIAQVEGIGKGVVIGMGIVTDVTFEVAGQSADGKRGGDLAKAAGIKAIMGVFGAALGEGIEKAVGEGIDEVAKKTNWERVLADLHSGHQLKLVGDAWTNAALAPNKPVSKSSKTGPRPKSVRRLVCASSEAQFVGQYAFRPYPV